MPTSAATSTSTTTTTTSTSLFALRVSASPPRLAECSQLLVDVEDAPPGHAKWSCRPAAHPLCARVVDQSGAEGFQLSTDDIGAVARAIRTGALALVSEVRLAVEVSDASGRLFRGGRALSLDVSRDPVFTAALGRRKWTALEGYVRLGVEAQACNSTGAVEWAWRKAPVDNFTVVEGQTRFDMHMAIAGLSGAGSYTFIFRHARARSNITFEVTILPVPPPTAALVAPVRAVGGCALALDASASHDPGGESLSFAWSCEALGGSSPACATMASQSMAPRLVVPGGSLGAGLYRFSVAVSRRDATSTANATVEVVSTAQQQLPAVSLGSLPEQVSPQLPLNLSAAITEDAAGGCVAPRYRSWFLCPVTSDGEPIEANATLIRRIGQKAGDGLVFHPDRFVTPGRYLVRLTLSDDADLFSQQFSFDSAAFVLDAPPANGRCRVFPEAGEVVVTSFRLDSLGWEDDDLPLDHRFSRLVDNDTWTILSRWSPDPSLEDLVFGRAGTATVQAEARDTLGSVSAATATLVVKFPKTAPSEADMLGVVARLASGGGSAFSTTAAIEAVASVGDVATTPEFSRSLLGSIKSSGILADATLEAINASGSALAAVLAGSLRRAPVVDVETAGVAAGVVSELAAAARDMADGMGGTEAAGVLGSVGTLLPSVAAGDGAEPSESQREVRGSLRSSVAAIGDALLKAQPVGEEAMVSSRTAAGGAGVAMMLRRAPAEALQREGGRVGAFALPALGTVVGARRLAGCADEAVGMQYVEWPSNLFGSPGSLGPGERGSGWSVEHWEIDPGAVVSMSLRLCGQELEVRNLSEPINFTISAPRRANDSDAFVEDRLCQYFDEEAQEWSSWGCWTVQRSDDSVDCACTHLSSFGVAIADLIKEVVDALLCANVNIQLLSTGRLRNLGRGTWAHELPALFLWLLLVMLASVFAVAQLRHAQENAEGGEQQPGDKEGKAAEQPHLAEEAPRRCPCRCLPPSPKRRALLMLRSCLFGSAAHARHLDDLMSRGTINWLLACAVHACIRQSHPAASKLRPAECWVETRGAMTSSGSGPNSAAWRRFGSGQFRVQGRKSKKETLQNFCASRAFFFKLRHPVFAALRARPKRRCINLLSLCASILGSMAVNVLLLQGSSHSRDASEACAVTPWYATFFRNAMLGVAASVIMAVPMQAAFVVGLACPSGRRRGGGEASPLADAVVCSCMLVVIAVSLPTLLSFLANMHEQDAMRWLVGAASKMLKSWLLLPLLLAVCLRTYVHFCADDTAALLVAPFAETAKLADADEEDPAVARAAAQAAAREAEIARLERVPWHLTSYVADKQPETAPGLMAAARAADTAPALDVGAPRPQPEDALPGGVGSTPPAASRVDVGTP